MNWKNITDIVADLPPCPRAYALARAAYETASEANLAEQRRETPVITADDPEPPEPPLDNESDREAWLAWHETWKAWHDRNRARLDAMAKRCIAKHRVNELQTLYRAAEKTLVEWAEERLQAQFGARFDGVKPMFEAWRSGSVCGDMRERFLKICFNCPA